MRGQGRVPEELRVQRVMSTYLALARQKQEMEMPVMQKCPDDHPLMLAWKAYEASEDYANSYKWATAAIEHVVLPIPKDPTANRYTHDSYRQFVQGSLWAAFMAGFNAATERAAHLHEQINPASDDERHHKVPGAGAMGAVIEYRDAIRQSR